MQEEAFAEPHVSVEGWPSVIEIGLAVRNAVVCPGVTVTVALAVAGTIAACTKLGEDNAKRSDAINEIFFIIYNSPLYH